MWFYSVVFFAVLGILSTGYFLKFQKTSYWICIFFLICIAGFRPADCCTDYSTYVDYYNLIDTLPYSFLEPTYFLFAYISRILFNSSAGVFILYSIFGVGLKGLAFRKLSKYYSLTLLLYFGSFYLLHEMTQIRVGVAAGILLLSVPSIVDKKPRIFIFYTIIGTLFHYSFIIFAPFYFLDPKKLNPVFYIGMIFCTIIAILVGLNIITFFQLIHLGFLSDKVNAYKALLDDGIYSDIKLLNPLLFLRIIILSILLFKWEVAQEKNKYSVVLIKVYAFSIFFFIALSNLPVLAGRISQLLGIAEIIVVPFIMYLINPKYVGVALSVLFALLIMYKQLFYSGIINNYF